MPTLLWDASALVKRYTLEAGSDTVDALFAAIAQVRMVATLWGYAETYASLWRKRNRGDISTRSFRSAVTLLRAEVLLGPAWELLAVGVLILPLLTHFGHPSYIIAQSAVWTAETLLRGDEEA